MEISAALATDLSLLSAAQYDPAAGPTVDIAHTLRVFATDLRLAVQSFAGLTITVLEHPTHAFDRILLRARLLDEQCDPADVATSLQLPLPTADEAAGTASIHIVFYATTPGAFVDMSADISFLTGIEFSLADLDQHRDLVNEPDITGVIRAQSTVSEATGVLIAHGHNREQAYAELDLMVELAGSDRISEATSILANLPNSFPKIVDG